MKRLLTLNDLYNYYSTTKKSTHFSSSVDSDNIVVQVDGKINFKKSDKDTEGLKSVYLQACHIDENVNGSNIKESVMSAALPSFSNRPILGYIHDVNGQPEFYGHNMHMDDDGNVVYDEVPIGVIPESCDAKLVYDKDKDKTYVEVKGYIFEEYSKAAEILEREQECFVSVELSIRELSYDAKNKYLDIEDFFFSGVTILGKNESGDIVKPGMTGSNIKLADFSTENNSMFSENDKLVEVLEKLNNTLSSLNINSKLEEGGNVVTKFEELLNQYGKTVEDITFEYENLSDEELEDKFAEVFGEDDADGEGAEPEPTSDGDEGSDDFSEEGTESDGESDESKSDEGSESEQFTEKLVRTFEISHEDVRYALYNLLGSYEEIDNDWYWITNVYDSYFVYENWDGSKVYRQNYAKDGDNIAFDGERVELFKELLTASEKAELEAMRSNYAEIKSQLEEYQAKEVKAQKEAIFSSDDYKCISELEAFAELKKEAEKYSVDELTDKLDKMIAESVKKGTFSFVPETKPQSRKVNFAQTLSEDKPKKNSFLDGLLNKTNKN